MSTMILNFSFNIPKPLLFIIYDLETKILMHHTKVHYNS